ncbi:MAG TPA: PCRF domain-containing protein, partial [Phycisphaeraceae bacterium]
MSQTQTRLIAKLDELAGQFDELEKQLSDPAVVSDPEKLRALSTRRAALADLVAGYRRWRRLMDEIAQHEQIIAEEQDAELTALARAELPELRRQAQALLEEVENELVTADDRAVGAVILELRAGTGGAEAALWAGDLLQMYQRY